MDLSAPEGTRAPKPPPAAVSRWENRANGRYYLANACRNLWGEWEVLRAWGAIGSRLGGQRREPVADEAAAQAGVALVAARRWSRGYRPL